MAPCVLLAAFLVAIMTAHQVACETPVKVAPATINGAIANHVNATFQLVTSTFMSTNAEYTVTSQGAVSAVALAEVQNGTVDFAITQNTPPSLEDCSKNDMLITFPIFTGVGGVFHNIPAPEKAAGRRVEVQLDACTLGAIFIGKITKWNDPAIVKLNAGLKSENATIRVIYRESDTTVIPLNTQFKEYIIKACPFSTEGYGGKTIEWPASPNFIKVSAISDVVSYLRNTSHSITILQASELKLDSEVAIENRDGKFVTSNRAQLPGTKILPLTRQQIQPFCWGDIDTTYMAGPDAHPLTYIVYFVAPSYNKAKSPLVVASFANYWLSTAVQSSLGGLGFFSLTPTFMRLSSVATSEFLGTPRAASTVGPLPTLPDTVPDIPDDKDGLSKVAIICIAVACALAVGMVASFATYWVMKRKRAAMAKEEELSRTQPEVGDVHMVAAKMGDNTV